MPSKIVELEYRGPFALHFHYEGVSARRAFWWDGEPVAIELTQARPDGPVNAEIFWDSVGTPNLEAIRNAVRHMIAADDDVDEFRTAVSRDRRMVKLIDALPGLKPFRVPDLWTTLVRSILAQQISTMAARSIRERLSRRYGRILDVRGEEVSVVPAAETVAGLTVAQLTEAGLSGRKAEYAIGIAHAFLDGRIVPEQLRGATPDEMIATLSSLRGVGVWTAECVGIFCLGHRDLLPADDLGIQQGVQQLYRLENTPTGKDVRKIGEKWAGWRSYASIYLWGGRNHGVLPGARLSATPKRGPAPAHPPALKADRKAPKLPAVRTGAKHHTPAAPGRRGR